MLTIDFTYFFLVGFIAVYVISHIPLDILMLISGRRAKYPSPDFKSFNQAFMVVAPTITFWAIAFIAPFIYFISGKDLLTFHYISVSLPLEWTIRGVGASLMFIGLIFDVLGRIARGKYLNYKEPVLVTKLSFAVVRHPQYLMYCLCFIGLPLLTFSPLLLLLIIGIKGYYTIALEEEKALIEVFGEEYKRYMEKVGRFLPRVDNLFKKW